MNKKEYISKINEIKASEELKARIIKGVNEGAKPNNKKNSGEMIKVAGLVAAASVAVVAAVLIAGKQNETVKPADETSVTNKIEVTTPGESESPTACPTENAVVSQYFTAQIEAEVVKSELAAKDKQIILSIKNNSPYRVYIDSEYRIEYEEGISEKGMSYAEYTPVNPVDYGYGVYVESGEVATVDITRSFRYGYSELIKKYHNLIIDIDVYTEKEVKAGKRLKATMTTGFEVQSVAKTRAQNFVPIENRAMYIYVDNRIENYGTVHYSAKFSKKNQQTFEWNPYIDSNGKQLETQFDVTLGEVAEERKVIPMNESFEPGVYMVTLTSEIEGLGAFEENSTFAVVGGGDISVECDKENYTSADDQIGLIFSDSKVKDFQSATYMICKVNNFENVLDIDETIVPYTDIDLNVEENNGKLEVLIDKPEEIEAGKYAVVVELIGGDEVLNGVGYEYTDVRFIYATFDIG